MKIEDIKKALGKSAEGLTVALVSEKVVTIDYPTLQACGDLSSQHVAALSKLGAVASSEQDMLGVKSAPRFSETNANAFTGPQRLTVRFA